MPDISGELGTVSAGTVAHTRAVPLSGWFSQGRLSALTGLYGTASLGTMTAHATGNVIWAASPSYADVVAAVALAATGDTVMIPTTIGYPNNELTWNARLTTSKDIEVLGSGIGQTILKNAGFTFVTHYGYFTRLGQMTLREDAGTTYYISISGDTDQLRIHHIDYYNQAGIGQGPFVHVTSGGAVRTQPYGVIDHCVLRPSPAGYGNGRIIMYGTLTGTAAGNYNWGRSAIGTAENIFIEDCLWMEGVYQNATDCNSGINYVVRYNTVYNNYFHVHGLQNSNQRAPHNFEAYENTFYSTSGVVGEANFNCIMFRGGTGTVYNNTCIHVSGADQYNYFMEAYNERGCTPLGNWWGQCDGNNPYDQNLPITDGTGEGSHTGANGASTLTCAGKTWATDRFYQVVAGESGYPSTHWYHYVWNLTSGARGMITANTANTVTATLAGGTRQTWNTGDTFKITDGYPCLDQIGVLRDYSESAIHPQILTPTYVWNNTFYGAAAHPRIRNAYCNPVDPTVPNAGKIVLGRDVIETARPGYTAYTYPHPLTLI